MNLVKILSVMAVTLTLQGGGNAQGAELNSTCETSVVGMGEAGHVTCIYPEGVLTEGRPVWLTVSQYFLQNNSDIEILTCIWNGTLDCSIVAPTISTYELKGHRLVINMAKVTEREEGRYICQVLTKTGLSIKPQPCELRLNGSGSGSPLSAKAVAGIIAAAVTVVVVIVIVYKCRQKRRGGNNGNNAPYVPVAGGGNNGNNAPYVPVAGLREKKKADEDQKDQERDQKEEDQEEENQEEEDQKEEDQKEEDERQNDQKENDQKGEDQEEEDQETDHEDDQEEDQENEDSKTSLLGSAGDPDSSASATEASKQDQ